MWEAVWKAVVFVEGENDANFLRHYLELLDYAVVTHPSKGEDLQPEADKICIYAVEGINKDSLFDETTQQKINPHLEKTDTALFVLDANGKPDERKEKFKEYKAKIGKKASPSSLPAKMELFLMPNNKDIGALENLLKKLTTPKSPVFACMERYRECLLKNGIDKKNMPNIKAEIYAYCDAHKLRDKDNKVDYTEQAQYWNLQSPALTPLKSFLTKGLGAP